MQGDEVDGDEVEGDEVEGDEVSPCGADGCIAAGESACVVSAVAALVERAGPDEDGMRGEVVESLRQTARRLEDTHPQGRLLASDVEVRAWAARLSWLLTGPTPEHGRKG